MSGFVSGVESDLTKGYQSMESIGTGLLDEIDDVSCHPLTSVERIGSTTMDVLRKGARYFENTAEDAYNKLRSGSRQGMQLAERELSNLDKVVTSHLPLHHTAQVAQTKASVPAPVVKSKVESRPEVHAERKARKSRKLLKKLVNWVVLVLVLVLIGVIVYLTCQRYLLVGSAFSSGNNVMAAALLTPELSTGLSTLAAAL